MSLLVGNSGRGGDCGVRAECAVAMMEKLKGMGKYCTRAKVRTASVLPQVHFICQQAVWDLCWLLGGWGTQGLVLQQRSYLRYKTVQYKYCMRRYEVVLQVSK